MNIELAHHWIVSMRGGEKVLEQFCKLFPKAPVHTLVHNRPELSETLQRTELKASAIQRLPGRILLYKSLLPFHSAAIKKLAVDPSADFLLSSDASLIKGLTVPEHVKHACYCHSPPRYLWEMADVYKGKKLGFGSLKNLMFDAVIPRLRRFDHEAAQRVDLFIANSEFVRERIKNYYGREAVVVNPPVEVDSFDHLQPREESYLVVSQLVPYKRIDVAVEAFNANGKKLIVIGDGSERRRLESIAKDNIQFLGWQPFSVLKRHFETCRAFVFPGIEDFGITPLEAQAAGSPVIAFRAGGAMETVVDRETGIFFDEQDPIHLNDAISEFEAMADTIVPQACRANAESYRPELFRTRIVETLQTHFPQFTWPRVGPSGPEMEKVAAATMRSNDWKVEN